MCVRTTQPQIILVTVCDGLNYMSNNWFSGVRANTTRALRHAAGGLGPLLGWSAAERCLSVP